MTSNPSVKPTRQFKIYAPLQEFHWSGNTYELWPGLRVSRFEQKPDLRELDTSLGEDEQNNIFYPSHWLAFDWIDGAVPSPAETGNLVLLALWLVKPTKTHIAFRFQLGHDAAAAEKSRQRLLDRFTWISGATHDDYTDTDLQLVAIYYQVLHDLCRARGRLNDALILTLAGCWSNRWQAALICHAAATEALLTYSTAPGITRRLSTVYACLVKTQAADRDSASQEFRTLYSVRSDIMHGRTNNVATADRLPILVRFQNVLRTLWSVVLSTPQLIAALEGSDSVREAHLVPLTSGYVPPP